MKLKHNQLDEQQERKLLEIESRGFWLAWGGSLIVMIVESLTTQDSIALAGNWILFMGLCLYVLFACTRAGIWARRLDMSRKTCLIAALLAGGSLSVYRIACFLLNGSVNWPRALAIAAVIGFETFLITYLLLRLGVYLVKKRQAKLNAEPEEEAL